MVVGMESSKVRPLAVHTSAGTRAEGTTVIEPWRPGIWNLTTTVGWEPAAMVNGAPTTQVGPSPPLTASGPPPTMVMLLAADREIGRHQAVVATVGNGNTGEGTGDVLGLPRRRGVGQLGGQEDLGVGSHRFGTHGDVDGDVLIEFVAADVDERYIHRAIGQTAADSAHHPCRLIHRVLRPDHQVPAGDRTGYRVGECLEVGRLTLKLVEDRTGQVAEVVLSTVGDRRLSVQARVLVVEQELLDVGGGEGTTVRLHRTGRIE